MVGQVIKYLPADLGDMRSIATFINSGQRLGAAFRINGYNVRGDATVGGDGVLKVPTVIGLLAFPLHELIELEVR
jgi:hypothetical protein